MRTPNKKSADKIKAYRKRMGLSVVECARRAGVSRGSWHRLERFGVAIPDIGVRAAKVLGVDPTELL
jgi:transcriptional regulator with XRE-family HTH domain